MKKLMQSISSTPLILIVLSFLISSNIHAKQSLGLVKIEDKKIIEHLKQQIRYEYESAYLYEARAHYALNQGLPGTSSWFKKQAQEERAHADKVINHLRDAGITDFSLPTLKSVPIKFKSILEAFETSLAREKELSRAIEKTAILAQEKKEYYTIKLMNWFIDEQIEEETMFQDTMDRIKWFLKMNNYPGMDDFLGKRLK